MCVRIRFSYECVRAREKLKNFAILLLLTDYDFDWRLVKMASLNRLCLIVCRLKRLRVLLYFIEDVSPYHSTRCIHWNGVVWCGVSADLTVCVCVCAHLHECEYATQTLHTALSTQHTAPMRSAWQDREK